MKNDLLSALLHISINGPPVNCNDSEAIITKAVHRYSNEIHHKAPYLLSEHRKSSNSYAPTETYDVDIVDVEEDNVCSELDKFLKEPNKEDYIVSNILILNSSDDSSVSDDN